MTRRRSVSSDAGTRTADDATPGVRGRTRDRLRDVVADIPAGARVELAWASWERIAELRGARALMGCAFLLALALGVAIAITPARVVFVDDRTGERYQPADFSGGRLLRGNRPADLDSALVAGMELLRLRFGHYDYASLNPALRALYARSTPKGRATLTKNLPRAALARLIVGDSGVARVRLFGAGPSIVGAGPGRAILTVPITARYYSRHVPFDGVKSGVHLGTTVTLTLVKSGPQWMLDDVQGELLRPSVLAMWDRFAVDRAPVPQVVVNGSPVPPDSVLAVGYRRGITYSNQFTR